MLISGRAGRGCSPAGGKGSQVPLLLPGAVYRHWGSWLGPWQPLSQLNAGREGAQQGVKPSAEPVELARRAGKHRSEELGDGGGDAGRAQGCWSSWASLSLVFSHCYPWHPCFWCPCPSYPWHSSPTRPHPMGRGASRTHMGGSRVKAQGTEGPSKTLQMGRRS